MYAPATLPRGAFLAGMYVPATFRFGAAFETTAFATAAFGASGAGKYVPAPAFRLAAALFRSSQGGHPNHLCPSPPPRQAPNPQYQPPWRGKGENERKREPTTAHKKMLRKMC